MSSSAEIRLVAASVDSPETLGVLRSVVVPGVVQLVAGTEQPALRLPRLLQLHHQVCAVVEEREGKIVRQLRETSRKFSANFLLDGREISKSCPCKYV